jgi:tetratricopeptide (TPR) repeat protein
MKKMTRVMGNALGIGCIVLLLAAVYAEETGPPTSGDRRPPVSPVRPPYGRGALPPPRPIEGGSYYHELAEVHIKYGVYDKAVEMLNLAIEKEADSGKKVRYYESLSGVYRMKGQPKEAAEQINKALAGAETLEEKCRFNEILAGIYEQAGDFEGAKKAYEFVVANATRDAQKRSAQLSLFRLYQRAGELEKVIADLEKKLEEKPDDEDALTTLAQIFNSVVRQPSRAISIYEELSKLKPTDIPTLTRLVYLYQSSREYEKAAEVYQRIIEASPARSKSYYYQHVSRMYMLAGKKEEATVWAEKSLSEQPSSPYTYISMAQLYLQDNLVEKAFELYDRAMGACQRPMEKQQVSLRFADLFAQNNREDKAEELYKYVLKEATVPAFKTQARSKLIALYRKQGKTSEIQALTGEEQETPAPPE